MLTASAKARLFLNNGGVFTKAPGEGGKGVFRCSGAFGDYDNDGDLEYALAGWTNMDVP
jgi:hypothetical protein